MKKAINKILIAPLDWGLGHATRCIPIVNELLSRNYEVVIASSGSSLKLLIEEFPDQEFLELPSYNMNYKNNSMAFNMFMQIPKLCKVIRREFVVLDEFLKSGNVDLIISDNRYGIHSNSVRSVFMGHQLAIRMPKALSFMSNMVNSIHKSLLKPFSEIWVPDMADFPNLSGDLSHGIQFEKPIFYIGSLSRFDREVQKDNNISLLIILSGIEPQRSCLEELILNQLKNYSENVVLVRGVLSSDIKFETNIPNIQVYNFLGAQELEQLVANADMVICRSGYSSIMDMVTYGKKVLYIPTPGQTEQEYLAKYHKEHHWADFVEQNRLNLPTDLLGLQKIQPLHIDNNNLGEYLEQLIN